MTNRAEHAEATADVAPARSTPATAQVTDPGPVPLLAPRDGLPPVIDTPDALADLVSAYEQTSGPVAIDAERASGYRYTHRAYLVQLRRQDVGTSLIDPIANPDLAALDAAIDGAEWVIHAAAQDLPCLAEIGLRPRRLFDTELAGRLLNFPRVGLAALVEEVLGYTLEKGHAAVDWSTRPLPEPWLVYAALDVEVLVELRDALHQRLADADKLDWALEEFAALCALTPSPPRAEPWRRTSGIHRVRSRRQLATVRALWESRDAEARRRDLSPGRVLPDAAIVAAASAAPASAEALAALSAFRTRGARRELDRWWAAVDHARALPDSALPEHSGGGDGPPPPRSWADRDPAAAERLASARAVLQELAQTLDLPVENLLLPDAVRRLTWRPPATLTRDTLVAALVALGARRWQVDLTADVLLDALASADGGDESTAVRPGPDEMP